MGLIDSSENLPEQIRVSLGSVVVLGLADAKLDAAPTTAYLMTYRQEKCNANCGFCPQARGSTTRADMLSRVSWPAYRTQEVLERIVDAAGDGRIKRVCIQALNYSQVFCDLHAIIRLVSHSTKVPISVSCQPLNIENMRQLADAGAERIGIPLDAATKEVFDRTKGVGAAGPYNWKKQWQHLKNAKKVFGEGKVSTHLIVGLGETDKEMVKTIQKCVDLAILPALFAFTPIPGTPLGDETQPQITKYRRIQTARHLILHRIAKCDDMNFDKNGLITDFGVSEETLAKIIQTGEPFFTSGCPGCNRPFYNEKPSGPIYNFPRELTPTELSTAKKQLSSE
ncbi:MAG TPA: radical SAM protein [candidate division Zixibacteria bacterium]|nr:radical SAM protein [candidate division Zixibacteria bacterium]